MNLITPQALKNAGLPTLKNHSAQKLLFRFLKIDRINELLSYSDRQGASKADEIITAIFEKTNIQVNIPPSDLKKLPKTGPFIVMANHPYGFLDGLIMIQMLSHLYPEFKVLANYFLKGIPPLADSFIELNPFENHSTDNIFGLKSAFRHLREGYPLGVFPAGEVATMQKGFGKIEDKEWDEGIIKFMLKANVPIVPMFFDGHNSLAFHLLGKVHPYLRTLSIPSEFFKKAHKTINVRIGKPITPSDLKGFDNINKAGKYMRTCLYALQQPHKLLKIEVPKMKKLKKQDPIIEAVHPDVLAKEIQSLPESAMMAQKSDYQIYYATSDQIPNVLTELSRLREITFREVGEGTNKCADADVFDLYYNHLFAWNSKKKEIIGAYRVGLGSQILPKYGKKGFYITSLFHLSDQMNPVLRQSIELGRSFITKAYQQKPLPLFLLWQGILHILIKDVSIKYIIGPVSISNDFTRFSKDLLIAFIKKYHYNHELAAMVYPKKEFTVKTNMDSIEVILEKNDNDLQSLDKFIAGIEPDYLKIPVLLKQYIKQKAQIIGFNIDPNFNDCLDGLMILDVNDLPESTYSFLDNGKK